ncbi:CRP-like cAMP-binding protein [Phyllobacterium trifolii]|jgi:hypothetical protein|uniref:CRP-like cAMP-binding protein n=1 Tax=Phyllobacterium trifolii TaxID=300193 RepID=A0A839UA63_9HYPH|nr:hypothetical protein [Phyllobacterium trifolii]MBB3147417.1 CRP-like cAMP-binding protein [Phyllobacterium trifolii]
MDGNVVDFDPFIADETRSRWLVQRVAILRNNPHFAPAALIFSQGVVNLFEGHYMANKVMATMARQVICMAVLALHFDHTSGSHGATISAIQRITTDAKLCSLSATAASIDLLEKIGLVKRIQDETDHRIHLIQPTDSLVGCAKNIVEVAVAAADRLFPLRHYRDLLDDAGGFMERYFASSLHSLLDISTWISGQPGSRLFAASGNGEILLCKLMSLKNSPGDSLVSFPFDEIGSLYGVSRTHIRRLMKRAEAEGLVRLLEAGGRKVKILPPLVDAFENMVAAHVAKTQFGMHLANKDYDLLPIGRCA